MDNLYYSTLTVGFNNNNNKQQNSHVAGAIKPGFQEKYFWGSASWAIQASVHPTSQLILEALGSALNQ